MPQALRTNISILSLVNGRRERHSYMTRIVEPASGIAPAEGKGNLYILLELEGKDTALARLYRELLNALQETYYYHNGDTASALTAAVRAAHTYLQQHNQYHHVSIAGGVTCLAATGSELVSAQAGPSILAIRNDAGLQWFSPLNRTDYHALGDNLTPAVEIGRVPGQANAVVVAMNSAWARYLEVPLMMEATAVPRAQAVADQLAGIGIDASETLTSIVVALTDASAATFTPEQRPASTGCGCHDDGPAQCVHTRRPNDRGRA